MTRFVRRLVHARVDTLAVRYAPEHLDFGLSAGTAKEVGFTVVQRVCGRYGGLNDGGCGRLGAHAGIGIDEVVSAAPSSGVAAPGASSPLTVRMDAHGSAGVATASYSGLMPSCGSLV